MILISFTRVQEMVTIKLLPGLNSDIFYLSSAARKSEKRCDALYFIETMTFFKSLFIKVK